MIIWYNKIDLEIYININNKMKLIFNLPEDIVIYIYAFCIDKRENWDKVSDQFLKGGFNSCQHIKKYMKNQHKKAINAASFRNGRNSKVTKWLRNIEKFETNFPEFASYLIRYNVNRFSKTINHIII